MLNKNRASKQYIYLTILALLGLTACQSPSPETATPSRTQAPSPTPQIGVLLETVAPPTQALVQISPTPSATPSPTPTATPIIYLITEGDTLLAIAIDHNTTPAEIEAYNPGIQPNLLQIGQQVILPPPATPSFQATAATQVPLEVEVIHLNQYRTPSGSLWLVGEVRNNSPLMAENIQLQIGLSTTTGQGLSTITTWVKPGIIPPRSKAPFGVLVPQLTLDANTTLAPPSAAIIAGQTLIDIGNRYLDLAVIEPEATIEETQVTIRGQIENTGETTADNIILVTTFYDVQGNVAGFHELTLDFSLTPGEQRPFNFIAAPPGGQVTTFSFLVQALKTE